MRALKEITEHQLHAVRVLAQRGWSPVRIKNFMPQLKTHQIRRALSGLNRSRKRQSYLPDSQQIEAAKAEITANWTKEQWSLRWVGRYGCNRDTNLTQAASKLMPY